MSVNATQLFEKLKALPARRLAEVEDFVDFLATKDHKRVALDRLVTIAPELAAAAGPQLSEEDLTAEIKAARAHRRANRDNQST